MRRDQRICDILTMRRENKRRRCRLKRHMYKSVPPQIFINFGSTRAQKAGRAMEKTESKKTDSLKVYCFVGGYYVNGGRGLFCHKFIRWGV